MKRKLRPCRWAENKEAAEIYCVFLHDDNTGCYPYCMCPDSLYKSMDDRRYRPCEFNITGKEVIELMKVKNE